MVKSKKGQLTIFIIIAVVIVAGVVIFLLVSDKGKGIINRISGSEFDIQGDLKTCIENNKAIKEKISTITSQGGSFEPQASYMYKSQKYEYLCYTNQDLQTCMMQQPAILTNVENEINKQIKPEVKKCFESTKSKLENRGYDVSLDVVESSVEFIPENLNIKSDTSLSATRGDERKIYNDFEFKMPSKLYELIMISTSILNFEARYGDSDPNIYMTLYPEIKVEKQKQTDGTTLYFISNRDTKEQFNFASRSLAFPEGYGLG